MKKLWTYNTQFPVESSSSYGSTSKKGGHKHPEDWAGHSVRMMLQLLYIVSMLCLLQYDEALRITWQDVQLEQLEHGVLHIWLDLPYRKTHQNGANPDKPWMCPVCAFAIMWKLAVANDGVPSVSSFGKSHMAPTPFVEADANTLQWFSAGLSATFVPGDTSLLERQSHTHEYEETRDYSAKHGVPSWELVGTVLSTSAR
ncbi:hypothetical protein B0H10DRAFT_1946869 [Mycena sp. CBHHK59/15]|nr:hypothetical protein B0H10DRAFT_1946869 [Mycena sp. CBHHK59/15]